MKSVLVLVTSLAASGQIASAGDITGTVTLNGTPPPEREITPLMADATCGKLHSGKVLTQFFTVGPNKELADVVVMLKGVPGKPADASVKPAVLDQKGCLYVPQILAVQKGQKLLVKNSDPMPVPMHNVHLNPLTPENQGGPNTGKLNMPQAAGAADLTYTFPAAENFIKFQCDVHTWMFAWVTVVDSPYFAVTGKDGSFKISGVPPGKYTVTALHYKAAKAGVDKEVEVKDGAAKVDFALEVK